jgi:sodium/bile acid cotransporter 7
MSIVNLQEPSAAEPMTDARKKVLVYSAYADYKKDFPAVEDMLPVEAMSLMNRNRLIFVDTRKPEEMAVSMLPGAITKEQFLQNPGLYRDKTVVTYCTISYRSGVFARDMKRKNIHMVNLTGGILAWIHEGGEVYNSRGQITNRVHVFGKRWNYAPDHYETVTFNLLEMIF